MHTGQVVRRMVLGAAVVATTIGVLPGIAAAAPPPPPQPPAVTDNTAPTISITTPANGGQYAQGSSLIAKYSCADAGGSGLTACVGTYANGAPLPTQLTGSKDFKVIASDGAGNITKLVVTYTIVDKTPPTITISSPTSGGTYDVGSSQNAHFTCNDTQGSGVASCVGTVADGSPFSTATVGTKSFTVNATDVAGNHSTKTVSYKVVSPPPVIKVLSPNGGQVWARGVSHSISWLFQNLPANARLTIQALKAGSLKQTIASNVLPSAGSINWVPSNSLAAGNDYKIKITVTGISPSTSDSSDANFTLT